MKSINKHIKINFLQKIKLFVKRNPWSITASIIALFTWWQEKVTIDELRSKIADFFRMENQTNQSLWGSRILEMQVNQTISLQKNYPNDSSYHAAFYNNVNNLIRQENLSWLYLHVQGDKTNEDSVIQIRNEKFKKDAELQNIMNSKNFDIIYKYNDTKTKEFSEEVVESQKTSQSTLTTLNEKLKQQSNRYFCLYLLAAIFFTIGKISNVHLKNE